MPRRTLVLILLATATSLWSEEPLQFPRETPVVAVYRRTHNAVANVSGEQTVSQRMGSQFDWPPAFDWS
jgi:hypothetical protein